MNSSFKRFVNETGKSLYVISKETGIPYTTLNELMNGKTNINKCSAETVYLLSLYFQCTTKDLLNPVCFLSNVSGTYHGVKYKWKQNQSGADLYILENGNETKIDGLSCTQERFYKDYWTMTYAMIDCYFKEKQAKEDLSHE